MRKLLWFFPLLAAASCKPVASPYSEPDYTQGLKRGHEYLTMFAVSDTNQLIADGGDGLEFFPYDPEVVRGNNSTNPLVRGNYLADFPLDRRDDEFNLLDFARAQFTEIRAIPLSDNMWGQSFPGEFNCYEFTFTDPHYACSKTYEDSKWQYLPSAQSFHFLRQTGRVVFEVNGQKEELTWMQSSDDAYRKSTSLILNLLLESILKRSEGKVTTSYNYLGAALHIVQDAFSKAHVRRDENNKLTDICSFGEKLEGACYHSLLDLTEDYVWSDPSCNVLSSSPNHCTFDQLKSDAAMAVDASKILLRIYYELSKKDISSLETFYKELFAVGCELPNSGCSQSSYSALILYSDLIKRLSGSESMEDFKLERLNVWSKDDALLSAVIFDPVDGPSLEGLSAKENNAYKSAGAVSLQEKEGWVGQGLLSRIRNITSYIYAKRSTDGLAFNSKDGFSEEYANELVNALPSLKRLSFYDGTYSNQIWKIKSIDKISSLTINGYSGEVVLADLPHLKDIDIDAMNSKVSLSKSDGIKSIKVSAREIHLDSLEQLHWLRFEGNCQITNECQYNKISLQNLPSLRYINIPHAEELQFENLEKIDGLNFSTVAKSEFNQVKKSITIKSLPNLTSINGPSSGIKSLSLANVPSLSWIGLGNVPGDYMDNEVGSIAFDELPSLRELNIGGNKFRSLASFANLPVKDGFRFYGAGNPINPTPTDCPNVRTYDENGRTIFQTPEGIADFCESYLEGRSE